MAIVINVARGTLVDHSPLVEALRDGEIAHAGLDLTDPVPLSRSSVTKNGHCHILIHPSCWTCHLCHKEENAGNFNCQYCSCNEGRTIIIWSNWNETGTLSVLRVLKIWLRYSYRAVTSYKITALHTTKCKTIMKLWSDPFCKGCKLTLYFNVTQWRNCIYIVVCLFI